MRQLFPYSLFFVLFLTGSVFYSCQEPKGGGNITKNATKSDSLHYHNHSDTARFVGIQTCRQCHQDIYNTFIKTGMGKSFDVASRQKSAGDYHTSVIYDKMGDFYYKAFWLNDSLQFLEYRLEGKDTIYKRQETVNFIIGSGQHTNSHLQSINGYLNQMPMTFYTQKKTWDLPPGFENGHNSRFMRKIGLECMSCHNSYPDFVMGSENKYAAVPEGINCERCHGPGSIHVAERRTGSRIDTSRFIDYSIVNPAKLSIDRQFDICQRCHLQGNTILKEGKSFYDFKPGMVLSDYMTVFLPKYKHADDEFIMASHADRLKQSACFIKSIEKINAAKREASQEARLKPYKDAMTCVTCHNPHVSVKETNKNVFNDACNSCHRPEGKSDLMCSDATVKRMATLPNVHQKTFIASTANCVGCHMPKSGSIDIPHVTVHDHYIRKPITKKDKDALKTFIGLYAINEKRPLPITKAKAYLNQYEKFEVKPYYLDSASFYLKETTDAEIIAGLEPLIQLYFIKNDYTKIIQIANRLNDVYLLQKRLVTTSYSNDHAWTCYRIGEACYRTGDMERAIAFFKNAVKLAPFGLDFRNKLGTAYASNKQYKEAEAQFKAILKEYPKHVSALTNLGYIYLNEKKTGEAEALYLKALALDPDYEPLLLNLAGLNTYKQDFNQAETYLKRILKRKPANEQILFNLAQISAKKNDLKQSKIYLQKILKLNPSNASAKDALNQIEKLL